MKLRNVFLSFFLLGSLCAAQADPGDNALALESTATKAAPASALVNAMSSAASAPRLSPSEQMGKDLSEMFREGAIKLDPPRSSEENAQGSEGVGVPEGGRSISVLAYSYCLTGRTASGRYTAPGIVAVDTRVIPMGSKLYIPGYGWGVAADTGGAIQGNKIDVWFPSLGQCYQWGVRPITIKVFPKK